MSLVLMMCWGAHAWFTWNWDFMSNASVFLLYLVFATIALVYKNRFQIALRKDSQTVFFLMFYVVAFLLCVPAISTIVKAMVCVFPLWVLLSDISFKKNLRFVLIFFATILVPGLLLFVGLNTVLQVPGLPIQYGEADSNTYTFFNYIFYIKNSYWAGDSFAMRFNSIFLEPAYLGTLLSFLLCADRFDLKKWYNIVILISLLLTFSLAGIITAFLGYILVTNSTSKKVILTQNKRQIFLGAAFVLILYVITINYNDGNNLVNELFFSRLEQTGDDKFIVGNVRTTLDTDTQFERLIQSGNILWGFRNGKSSDYIGAGYKIFFLQYGLLPAIAYLLMYLSLGAICKNKHNGRVFVLLVVLTFLQAAYPSSFSWIVPMIFCVRNET